MTNLGRLEKVELRDVWQTEAGDFTPWLASAENLERLSNALELDLELEAQEKNVGPFRADILCRDLSDGTWVLIENQLERSDHTHLGQLLTYTAGLKAAIIVWIAKRFTDEHRAALDWLNEQTSDGIVFFGLEIELWRIGDSAPAPKFNIVSRPNEWTRSAVQSRANPERAKNAAEYWSGVLAELEGQDWNDEDAKPMRKHDMRFPAGWRDFWLKAYFSTYHKKLGVWVACKGPNWRDNFDEVHKHKQEIEAAIGSPMEWNEYENSASLFLGFDNIDPTNKEDWDRQHSLLAKHLIVLHDMLNPLVQRLDSEC